MNCESYPRSPIVWFALRQSADAMPWRTSASVTAVVNKSGGFWRKPPVSVLGNSNEAPRSPRQPHGWPENGGEGDVLAHPRPLC
jgi:hypothetical protein